MGLLGSIYRPPDSTRPLSSLALSAVSEALSCPSPLSSERSSAMELSATVSIAPFCSVLLFSIKCTIPAKALNTKNINTKATQAKSIRTFLTASLLFLILAFLLLYSRLSSSVKLRGILFPPVLLLLFALLLSLLCRSALYLSLRLRNFLSPLSIFLLSAMINPSFLVLPFPSYYTTVFSKKKRKSFLRLVNPKHFY